MMPDKPPSENNRGSPTRELARPHMPPTSDPSRHPAAGYYSGPYLPPPMGFYHPYYHPAHSSRPPMEPEYRTRYPPNTISNPSQLRPTISTRPLNQQGHMPSEEELVMEAPKREYELVTLQQPQRARMCGCGDKDRRAVDPPPIVQLIVKDTKENGDSWHINEIDNTSNLVMYVSLWSADGEQRITTSPKIPHHLPILLGTLGVNSSMLLDVSGNKGLFFIFQDLSNRSKGMVQKTHVAASLFSDSFTVFTPKTFPGMSDSSDLSKAFASQGVKLPIRKERPKASLNPSNDTASEARGDTESLNQLAGEVNQLEGEGKEEDSLLED